MCILYDHMVKQHMLSNLIMHVFLKGQSAGSKRYYRRWVIDRKHLCWSLSPCFSTCRSFYYPQLTNFSSGHQHRKWHVKTMPLAIGVDSVHTSEEDARESVSLLCSLSRQANCPLTVARGFTERRWNTSSECECARENILEWDYTIGLLIL